MLQAAKKIRVCKKKQRVNKSRSTSLLLPINCETHMKSQYEPIHFLVALAPIEMAAIDPLFLLFYYPITLNALCKALLIDILIEFALCSLH